MDRRIALLVLSLAPVAAQLPRAEPIGTVAVFADGLESPQGLALTPAGEVLVVEHNAGRVSRYSAAGERLGVLAEGLNTPAFAYLADDGALYVGERKGNRVLRLRDGVVEVVCELADPLGLIAAPDGELMWVVSHPESAVFAVPLAGGAPEVVDAAPDGPRYGARDLALAPDGTLYLTDEARRVVYCRPPGGEWQRWLAEVPSPSGLAIGADGLVYLTAEGDGSLWRLDPAADRGAPVLLASGLGTAREVLIVGEGEFLVSDRAGGVVYRVTVPAG